jgi:hypothetical protein
MGWSLGYDDRWKRDIGYGVPAWCDNPECNEKIDRGLAYVCCDEQPYGGDDGCGLYFCDKHRCYGACCHDFKAKQDHPEWIEWKLTDASWQRWREENPKEVERLLATTLPLRT